MGEMQADYDENALSVEKATVSLYNSIAVSTGWKFLKSQKCLKMTVKDVVFEIDFFTSKYNGSDGVIDVNAQLVLWYKGYSKCCNVDSIIGSLDYRPENDNWYDISTEEKLRKVSDILNKRMSETAVMLYHEFQQNYDQAVNCLLEKHFEEYNIRLDFLADQLGTDAVRKKAKEIYTSYSDCIKMQITDYLSGDRSKGWMINRSNIKYIADNKLFY